ncbi:MAG TPA: DNA polymerase IV, partial [Phycisphaerae bacterium]|nr:DNA polymerase IV [Phycisphaerae bacterium]
YEARRFGLRAAMSLHEARRLCPRAAILKGDYQIYRCFAEHVWDICRRFTCGLQTLLDEAYGDATGIGAYGEPLALGRRLQGQVREEVGLPVSVGLGANRFLAKTASSAAKPNGVVWIRPGSESEFLDPLPVDRLLGVGPKTRRRLEDMNIHTIGRLRAVPREALRSMFGLRGLELYERCRGRDGGAAARAVEGPPQAPGLCRPRPPRSISRETTLHQPTCDEREIGGMLFYLLERAMRAARRARLLVGTVSLSIRYDDWKQAAASRSLPRPTQSDWEIYGTATGLLKRLHQRRVAIRHLGVELTNFSPESSRAALFEAPPEVRRRQLHHAVDEIRDRYGHAALITGKAINLMGHLERNDYGFVLRTPSLTK